jgi:hypothetical protein
VVAGSSVAVAGSSAVRKRRRPGRAGPPGGWCPAVGMKGHVSRHDRCTLVSNLEITALWYI